MKCKDCKNMAAPNRGRCETCLAKYREYARGRMDILWEQSLIRKYGIDADTYHCMLESQDGNCAICDQPESAISRWGTPMRLAVDHCHETGRVRGLLCRECNQVLGKVNDDPDRLRRMADYLDEGMVS